MQIRPERPEDVDAIRSLTGAAFKEMIHSSQTEAAIIDALRNEGALTLSLVALQGTDVVGHAAFSPVTINNESHGWYGLGPVSVLPNQQSKGIGQALINEGLKRLQHSGAHGCVVLGDPGYYSRFGFRSDPRLLYAGAQPEYFMCLAFSSPIPRGEVAYHPGFSAS